MVASRDLIQANIASGVVQAPLVGPAPPPLTRVVAWNLSAAMTTDKLLEELLALDYEPQKVTPCADLLGAFVLDFREVWHANALVVGLDARNDLLPPFAPDKDIRFATWVPGSPGRWSSDDVPPELQAVTPPRI